MKEIEVALIGNPNVGKSLIFNNLTGGRAHVGNWPGKTVEKKEGRCIHKGVTMRIIDLPGVYSLTAASIDELIARNYIVEERPDVVVDIVDASNLERNLYLTLQLLELEANLVIALNKSDIAEGLGYEIDVKGLSELLGVPVVPTIATVKVGMEELKDAIVEASKRGVKARVRYREDIEELIERIGNILKRDENLTKKYPARWLAIKIIEGDKEVMSLIEERGLMGELREVIG